MVSISNPNWESLKTRSPTLFLVAGMLLIGHAATQGLLAFTDLTPPPDVFVTTGHLVALLGLVGLYPSLVNQTPTLARAGVTVAVIPLLGWVVMTVTHLLSVAGTIPSLNQVLPGTLIMLVVGSTILTYVLFGLATLRTGKGSRTTGLLVLAPAALIIVLLVDSAITGASALDGLLIGGGLALSMLALGYTLRSWNHATESAAPAADASVG